MELKTKPLSDQIALVTGGGTGIGRAFSEALSAAGARVCIASRRKDVLEEAAARINEVVGRERVFPYAFDVRAREQCGGVVRHCVERFGSLDVLVNNSGL